MLPGNKDKRLQLTVDCAFYKQSDLHNLYHQNVQFSTLYTTIPHDKLKSILFDININQLFLQ